MSELFVATAPGLEEITTAEVGEILPGFDGKTSSGGITLDGDEERLATLLLHLSTASRVLVRFAHFRARGFPELERHLKSVDLSDFREGDRPVRLEITSRKSRLYHTGAIEERMRRVLELGTAPADEDDSLRIVVRVLRDDFILSVDASGAGLHRRGYRLRTAKAPIRETLAAALLRASGWDAQSPLADPFCGSGTLPIEAARFACGIPAGSGRSFDAESWPTSDPTVWAGVRSAAEDRPQRKVQVPIIGSDRDAGAIEASNENAERAGVSDLVEFVQAPVSDAPIPPGALVITNPPYGKRIEGGDIRNLLASFGRRVMECEAGAAAVITDDPNFGRMAGLALKVAHRTRNGGIDVVLLTS